MGERLSGNPWRQGHVLSVESAKQLDIVHSMAADDPVVLVISHDCDLAAPNDAEPECEVIPGRHIETADGVFSNAKNPRKLHLTFSGGSVKIIAEFVAVDKRAISKKVIFQHAPSANVRLSPAEFTVLQNWLAARYRRASFADEFESRLKRGKLYKKFVEIIQKAGTHLLAVFFDVDSGEEVTREGAEDTYSLGIHLVFNVTEDPGAAEVAVKRAADEIKRLFEQLCFINGKWVNIELRECEAISEGVISIYESRLYKQWQFDYLSLREEPQGQMLAGPTTAARDS